MKHAWSAWVETFSNHDAHEPDEAKETTMGNTTDDQTLIDNERLRRQSFIIINMPTLKQHSPECVEAVDNGDAYFSACECESTDLRATIDQILSYTPDDGIEIDGVTYSIDAGEDYVEDLTNVLNEHV